MFGTSPQSSPYLGYPQVPAQMPQGQLPVQQAQLLQQLMANPAFLARLQQLRGTGLGGMQIPQGGFGQPQMGIQPSALGAQSLR